MISNAMGHPEAHPWANTATNTLAVPQCTLVNVIKMKRTEPGSGSACGPLPGILTCNSMTDSLLYMTCTRPPAHCCQPGSDGSPSSSVPKTSCTRLTQTSGLLAPCTTELEACGIADTYDGAAQHPSFISKQDLDDRLSARAESS